MSDNIEIQVTDQAVEVDITPQVVEVTANVCLPGIPAGGTIGQVLAKSSNADYAVTWVTGGGGGGGAVWGAITGTVTDQTDLVNYVALRVPYTGATSDVNLGEYGVQLGNIEFDLTPTGAPTGAGSMVWDDATGTVGLVLKGGNVSAKIGQDLYARVVNKIGSNLTKANYRALRVSTPQGQRMSVLLAQGNNDTNSAETIGINAEDIANNQEGYIITFGQIAGINTTGSLFGETWSDGDVLYVSPTTAGYITNIKPLGQHIVVLGYVEYAHQNNGKIFVKVMNGWELEELHDVVLSSPTNGQVLTYNLATDKWINASIPTVNTLYSADGTLSGSRIVTIPTASSLTFRQDSLDVIRFSTNGNTFIGNATSPKTVYINNFLRVYGTAFISDEPTGDAVLKVGSNRTGNGNTYIDLIGDTTYTTSGLRIRRYDTGPNANSRIENRGTGSLQLVAIDAGNVELWTNGSSRVFVDPSGGVGVNTITPDTSAQLHISSTTKGTLLTRMTTTQRNGITIPATGLILYNTTTNTFDYYNGTSWVALSTGGGVSDGDKGDITVTASGATWTIDNTAVTYAKIQNVAANSFLANVTGSSATVQEIATNRIPLFASAITGTPSASTFLRGDGSWQTVSGTGTVTTVSVVSANGFAGTVANATTTPAITLTTTITGLLKGNGTAISAATAGTDFQSPISLTTTGTSGAATFISNTLNIPNYSSIYSSNGTLSGNREVNLSTNFTLNFVQNSVSRLFIDSVGDIGINQSSPDASAILDVASTNKGVLVPRMTATQRNAITTPATSLFIYNTDTNLFNYYNGTSWSGISVYSNPMTTLGDTLYGGASGAATRLAGNTTTTKQFLTQTGTGTVSAAPAWGTILGADVPNFTDTLSGTVPASGGGTTNFLRADGTWAAPSGGGGGITTLNTLTAATQTFAVGTSGTDFNISSATSTHTFNIPDASLTARGLVTTGSQSFNGDKTFRGSNTTQGTFALTAQNSTGTTIFQARNDGFVLVSGTIRVAGTGTLTLTSTSTSAFIDLNSTQNIGGSGGSGVSNLAGCAGTSGSGDINLTRIIGTINMTSTNTSLVRGLFVNNTFTSVTGSYRGIDILAPSSVTGGGTITYLQCRTSTADVFVVQPTVITVGDAVNFALNTTTGTKFGTSTSQKLGFFNATPIVQPTTAVGSAAFTANTGTAVNDASTFGGYTIGQVVQALENLGLLA